MLTGNATIIKSADVFNRCTDDEANNLLAPYALLEKYAPKRHIYSCGNKADGVRIVITGKVKEFQMNSFGKELITYLALPNNTIGWENVITGRNFTQCAIAIGNVRTLKIPSEDIRFLLKTNSDFSSALAKHLSEKVIDAWEKQMSYLYQPVRQRMARSLSSLQRIYQSCNMNSRLPANRNELAKIAGVTRETATRLIKEFEKAQLLKIEEDGISITDSKGIEDLGHQYF